MDIILVEHSNALTRLQRAMADAGMMLSAVNFGHLDIQSSATRDAILRWRGRVERVTVDRRTDTDAVSLRIDEDVLRSLCTHIKLDPVAVGLTAKAPATPAPLPQVRKDALTVLDSYFLHGHMSDAMRPAAHSRLGEPAPPLPPIRAVEVPRWLWAALVAIHGHDKPMYDTLPVVARADDTEEPVIRIIWGPDPYGMRVARAVLDACATGEPDIEAVVQAVPRAEPKK